MCEEKKFKVSFSGFCYVYADSVEEAIERYEDDDYAYAEQQYGDVEEVDEFIVEM